MTRVGQCPCCLSHYELDDDDLGHLLECECGVTLIACRAEGIAHIPVTCDACKEAYDVECEDAGQVVECECGQQLTVPTAVLRQPISGTGPSTSPTPSTDPVAGNQPAESARSAVSIEVDDSKAATPPESKPRPSGQRRQKSWDTWLGFGAVLGLLVVSVVMFALRDDSPKSASSSDSGRRSSPGAESGQPPPDDNVADNAPSQPIGSGPDLPEQRVSSGTTPVPSESEVDSTMSTTVAETLVVQPEAESEDSSGDTFRLPAAPLYALPEKQPSRTVVPIMKEKHPFMTLTKAIEEAFDAYEETQSLLASSEETKSDADTAAYHQSLGRTLDLLIHVHGIAMRDGDLKQLNSLRYLLAYLHYNAGHLAEAAIYGEAVARWGEKEEPATKEAAMIALAAAQEAIETHWGDPEQVGELYQMEAIANVLTKRWPDDRQLSLVWMNLAYLYEAFNRPDRAIGAYASVPKNSPEYGDAQISSGIANWVIARRQAAGDNEKVDRQRRKLAEQQLQRGLKIVAKQDEPPTEKTIEVRVNLAQIALSDGRSADAEAHLSGPQGKVLKQIAGRADSKEALPIQESFIQQFFDLLFTARQLQGDSQGAQEAIEMLASTSGSEVMDLQSRLITTVKRAVDRLQSKPIITRKEVEELTGLTQPMMNELERYSTPNLLWLGESWGQLGEHAANVNIAKRCAANGASLYAEAMLRTDFPAPSMQSARLRRIELLQTAGELEESLQIIREVLAKNPNVFALQIAAADSLQAIAEQTGKRDAWVSAIDGPQGFSTLWGWAKLVTTLHGARYADNATENHVRQFKHAQYSLAVCRIGLARTTRDLSVRTSLLADVERSLQTTLATMDKDDPWYDRFMSLRQRAGKSN